MRQDCCKFFYTIAYLLIFIVIVSAGNKSDTDEETEDMVVDSSTKKNDAIYDDSENNASEIMPTTIASLTKKTGKIQSSKGNKFKIGAKISPSINKIKEKVNGIAPISKLKGMLKKKTNKTHKLKIGNTSKCPKYCSFCFGNKLCLNSCKQKCSEKELKISKGTAKSANQNCRETQS
jgi:hypothetical protein